MNPHKLAQAGKDKDHKRDPDYSNIIEDNLDKNIDIMTEGLNENNIMNEN